VDVAGEPSIAAAVRYYVHDAASHGVAEELTLHDVLMFVDSTT
jgi:hypothetical protein